MNIKLEEKKKNKVKTTYTTGDIGYNIKQFNKRMGTDFNNPSTIEASQKAAEDACAKVGTFAAASPDGGNSVSLGGGDSAGAGGGECCGESLSLQEDQLYAAKLDTYVELPSNIHIIDKQEIEKNLEDLEPEEEFEVGYITPVYLYKELVDKFTLLKCTQLVGYTGIDYIEARANDEINKERRLQIARDTMALGSDNGTHFDRQPNAKQVGDFSAKYASTNKTVLQNKGNTLLFYPKIGSKPKVLYYLDLYNGKGYLPVKRELLEQTILEYVRSFINELETGVKKDGTPRKLRWGDAELASKLRKQLDIDSATITAVALNKEDHLETRSKISNGDNIEKPQVRALYTGQIYYLKTGKVTLGTKLIEELTEAKRYVRRYYIRPQNIFCSNKTDVLNALIEFADQDCSVYTLNNLGDVKDVTKLTNKDIIYYYDDGILYDKNRVKIMDYDLYIKHEENRPKIDPDKVSDAKFADVYEDRLTGNMTEEFNLDFDSYNAYGEKLVEGKVKDGICCICGEEIDGYGNNAEPYKEGRCCDACNLKFVIPARMEQEKED